MQVRGRVVIRLVACSVMIFAEAVCDNQFQPTVHRPRVRMTDAKIYHVTIVLNEFYFAVLSFDILLRAARTSNCSVAVLDICRPSTMVYVLPLFPTEPRHRF